MSEGIHTIYIALPCLGLLVGGWGSRVLGIHIATIDFIDVIPLVCQICVKAL